MEHSALHAVDLLGQVIGLGGAFFVLGLLGPAHRKLSRDARHDELQSGMLAATSDWVTWGLLAAALATVLNLFVDVAETQGRTVFGGVPLALACKFAFQTRIGQLSLARIGVLLLTAAFARFKAAGKWWLVLIGSICSVALTSLISHAAAQPTQRAPMIAAQITHIAGAALWVGVLIHLLAARRQIEGGPGVQGIGFLAEIIRRFSPVALAVTSLLGISGLWMICRFLNSPLAVVTSAYGLTLIVKLLLLTPAIYAGLINFRVIRPAMIALRHAGDEMDKTSLLRRFGRTLELEVTAGVLVITAAGILASVSPPGEAGAYRLTSQQARAVLHPHLPVTKVISPIGFYGADERTPDDLRYAEFTHNWSGIMVCLLGLGWLGQNASGRLGLWAKRGWPLLLIPFAIFIAVASDPEVWWFHQLSPLQVLRDPQLLEHQLGAVMVLILAWLGWRCQNDPMDSGAPLYMLPIILTAGGILLLGHAHSTLTITEELTNLINFQHAVFGSFILLAGTIHWLAVRNLFPKRLGNFIWPCFVIALGLYMAFYYRETV